MKGIFMQLNQEELINVEGGAIRAWLVIGAGVAIFIAGVIDGYIRPLKCN